MGRRANRAGKTKQYTHVHTVGKTVERTIKRDELDLIASICGTTRDTTGEVQRRATSTEYDDGAERANSESVHEQSDTTSTTTERNFSAV